MQIDGYEIEIGRLFGVYTNSECFLDFGSCLESIQKSEQHLESYFLHYFVKLKICSTNVVAMMQLLNTKYVLSLGSRLDARFCVPQVQLPLDANRSTD